MIPQGSAPFDCAYIQAIVDEINALSKDINSLNPQKDLQELVNEAFASLQAQITAAEGNIAILEPMIALLSLSITDLGSVITFLEKFVQIFLGPTLQAYFTLLSEIAAVTNALAQLTTAINNAMARFENVSVTIPPITIPTISFSPPSLPSLGVSPPWSSCEIS